MSIKKGFITHLIMVVVAMIQLAYNKTTMVCLAIVPTAVMTILRLRTNSQLVPQPVTLMKILRNDLAYL